MYSLGLIPFDVSEKLFIGSYNKLINLVLCCQPSWISKKHNGGLYKEHFKHEILPSFMWFLRRSYFKFPFSKGTSVKELPAVSTVLVFPLKYIKTLHHYSKIHF